MENQQFGIVDHGLGQSYPLQHATRELSGITVRVILQTHNLQNFSRAFIKLSSPHAVERAVKANQPFGTTMVEGHALCEKAHTTASARITKGFSEQTTVATRGLHKTHGEVNSRTLACTVWSEETEDLSSLHREAETVESAQASLAGEATILFRDILELEHETHRRLF